MQIIPSEISKIVKYYCQLKKKFDLNHKLESSLEAVCVSGNGIN